MQKKRRIGFFILVLVFGIIAGLAYGWLLMPAQPSQTTLSGLRQDFKSDYVLMAAEVYHSSNDLDKAKNALSQLGPDWLAAVRDALSYGQSIGYSQADLDAIAALEEALLKLSDIR